MESKGSPGGSVVPLAASDDRGSGRGHPPRWAGGAPGDGPGSGNGTLERDLEGETVRCPRCGATNAADPSYVFCWHCVARLDRAPI